MVSNFVKKIFDYLQYIVKNFQVVTSRVFKGYGDYLSKIERFK
jgi:hypothetical protein